MALRFNRMLSTDPFRSDRQWSFGLAADELWDRLEHVEDYEGWWPWLRSFESDGGLQPGARWHCVVAPPLPYVVRFTVHVLSVEGRVVDSTVDGDIRGSATLTVDGSRERSTARLASSLEPANPVLRKVGLLARPVVEWGHDWVLDQGRRQFEDRAVPRH